MAELTPFSYRPGASVLHLQDVRFKLAFIVIISIASMKAYFISLSVLSFALFSAIFIIHLPLKSILKELRYFFIFLIFVFAARALSTPGTPLIEFIGIDITRQGIYNGTLVCWRMLLIVLAGLLFVSTTRPSEIRAAVEWFLSPFPFIPGKRVATMMSLIIRFIPVILQGLYNERKAVKQSMLDDKQKMENDPNLDLNNQIAAKNTIVGKAKRSIVSIAMPTTAKSASVTTSILMSPKGLPSIQQRQNSRCC